MKLLLLGIDDAELNIIQNMDMPFLNNLIANHVSVRVEEDLLSRGWAEIYTGRHARETKAFYDYPLMDKSYWVSQEFNSSALPSSVVPIWNRLSQRNQRVGIMNVPTTSPATDINGFMIGGGGGGRNKLKTIAPELCNPPELVPFLNQHEYIVDLRLTTSGIKSISEFFSTFSIMVNHRTRCFIELCKKGSVDFSFIVYRALAIIQYLGMSEIEYMTQSKHKPKGNPNDANSVLFRNELKQFFRFFDDMIRLLFDELQPKRFIIVSDHGKVPYLHNINCNEFLSDINLLSHNETVEDSYHQLFRKWVPKKIRSVLAGMLSSNIEKWLLPFNGETTRAFSLGLINGIYINDQQRFGGPVTSSTELMDLTRSICNEFNNCKEASAFNMHARPYREAYMDTPYSACLPDIWIDKPDTIRPFGKGGFIHPNDHYQHITTLADVYDDNWTGIKSRYPLLITDHDTANVIDKENPDLTMVYEIVNRVFT